MDNKEKFIFCECGGDLLVATWYKWDDKDQDINLAIFNQRNHPKYGFWYRIKYVLKVLWTGEPYDDLIIMRKEKAAELRDFLNEFLAE